MAKGQSTRRKGGRGDGDRCEKRERSAVWHCGYPLISSFAQSAAEATCGFAGGFRPVRLNFRNSCNAEANGEISARQRYCAALIQVEPADTTISSNINTHSDSTSRRRCWPVRTIYQIATGSGGQCGDAGGRRAGPASVMEFHPLLCAAPDSIRPIEL